MKPGDLAKTRWSCTVYHPERVTNKELGYPVGHFDRDTLCLVLKHGICSSINLEWFLVLFEGQMLITPKTNLVKYENHRYANSTV
jgi:hypothetical protein